MILHFSAHYMIEFPGKNIALKHASWISDLKNSQQPHIFFW